MWQLLEGDWTVDEPSCPLRPMKVVLKGGRGDQLGSQMRWAPSVACWQPHCWDEAPMPGPPAALPAVHTGDGPEGCGGLGNARQTTGDRVSPFFLPLEGVSPGT